MAAQAARPTDRLFWLVVLLVGVIVLAVVFGLQLFPRLSAGNQLLNGARPAFTAERVAGDRAGISFVSAAVDLVDPLVTAEGAAAEIPGLIDFAEQRTGLPEATILTLIQNGFPRTAGLLQALPLTDVNAELPGLVAFLSENLNLTPDEVTAAIAQNFPQLNQSIQALGPVTEGWNDVPGIEGLTRFNGDAVTTTPQLRDYFRDDVITAVESQQAAFQRLDTTWPPVNWIPPLLTFLGIVVVIFGAVMIALSRAANLPPAASVLTWSIVAVLGLVVLLLVLGLQLYPRLGAGNQVLDGLRPAFTAQRVSGDRAGIDFVSEVVDLADPLITADGAAAEVPQLIAFAAERTGLAPATVLNLVQNSFPHTAGLLQALPLTELNAEMPRLMSFLAANLGLTPEELSAALGDNFPQLTQAIQALDPVTSGWNSIPGIEGLTRFSGEPVTTVPQLRDYFRDDVIPVLENQQAAYQRLDTTWPPVNFFPPLLTVVGLIVLLYGILMVLLAKGRSAAIT